MNTHKKNTPKRIAALLCVVILVLLYVVTLISAFLDFPGADRLFAACLVATIGLPIVLWLLIWFYGIWKKRREEALKELAGEEER